LFWREGAGVVLGGERGRCEERGAGGGWGLRILPHPFFRRRRRFCFPRAARGRPRAREASRGSDRPPNPSPAAAGPGHTEPLNPGPSTLDPQPLTLNPGPSTLDPQPWTLNPGPSSLDPQPLTLNPGPSTGCRQAAPDHRHSHPNNETHGAPACIPPAAPQPPRAPSNKPNARGSKLRPQSKPLLKPQNLTNPP
jgi:hypothetical protein